MNNPTCRIPSPLDRQFAKSHSANEYIIANLRGLYETRTKDTINSVDEYLTKLLPFKNKLLQEDKKVLDNILNPKKTTVVATVLSLLKREFTDGEIQELTDLLYSNFIDVVNISLNNPTGELKSFITEMKKQGKYFSRVDVIKHIGVDNILLKLVSSINSLYYNPKKKATYMNPLLKKLIEGNHIDTFLWLARDEIYKREGVKFGRKIKYIVEFKNDETLEADYKVEDTIKDGWMREMEKESPFRNIGQEVRSYLGRQILYNPKEQSITITDPETKISFTEKMKVPVTSKNGFRKLHSPGELHKTIQNMLTGCRDMNHMLKIFERAAKEDVNMQNIYNDLMVSPQLAAAFYKDFKKTKCNFSKAFYDKAHNLRFQLIRSTSKKLSFYHYSHSFTSETNLSKTIFKHDDDGNVAINGDKLNDFKEYISENIGGNSFETTVIQSSSITANPDTEAFYRQSYMAAQQIVKTISDRLGFELTDSQIESLIKSRINLKSFLADAKALAEDRRVKADTLLSEITRGIFKDRISSMLSRVNDSASNSTKSVRIGDSTYFTDIVTSKVSNTIDMVKSFAADAKYALSLDDVSEQDRILEEVVKSLKAWIMDTYGCSSEYYIEEDDDFRHEWLHQLYNTSTESLKDLDSFIYHFDYDRAMVFDGILAEDFSADLDLKTFIVNYFSNNIEPDSGYARYPLFTTGDSLALKFITARKYGYNTLINKFIGVARQEIARMQLEAQVKDSLTEKRYNTGKITTLADKSINAEDEVTGDFIYLKFLNRTDVKDEKGKTYKERIREALKKSSSTDKTPFIEVMKDILKKELFEEYKNDFFNKIKDTDSFIADENNRFKEFPNFYNLNPSTVENDSPSNGLFMYYLNTKLAYIYQYQFLGANPAAYGLSTVMQKRYKAYNAPGNPMNIWAKDFDGNYYIKTETILNDQGEEEVVPVQEKVVYFKDTHISAEDTDPEFMKALAYQWGKQALGAGAHGMSEEAIIEEGKKDSRYKMYKDNDATDGQGYRVLESYRRVMGMAKQWTQDMENAYKRIQEMRRAAWERAASQLYNKSYDSLTSEEQYRAKLKSHFTASEIDELNEMPAFQPIKPHTSTVEKVSNGNGDMLLVPVEHKYAEALVIPEFYPENSFLRTLGVEMEEGGIDLSCSEQCVKVGSFGATQITNISDLATKAKEKKRGLPPSVKTDKTPFRIINVEKGLDFNISVGDTYDVDFDKAAEIFGLNPSGDGRKAQFYILGYEQEDGKLPLEVWYVSSEHPDVLESMAVSSMAGFIDSGGRHLVDNVENVAETTRSNFRNAYVHSVDYADYTIQTHVPEHINASQLFGTQLRKHVFDAINLLLTYNYGGVDAVKVHGETLHLEREQGGKAFLKFYNALICENMNSDLLDLTKKLSDSGKLSDLLSELKSNDFDSSIEDTMRFGLDENGEFIHPIGEPSRMYDIESILTSIFKREVNKQHINGGSCVQVSDYGLSSFGTELKVHTDKAHNITTVDCAMAWDLSWTDAAGNKVPLKFSTYCNADGTLIENPEIEKLKKKIEKTKETSKKVAAYQKALDEFDEENKNVAPADRKMSGKRAKKILSTLLTEEELDNLIDLEKFNEEWTYYDLLDFIGDTFSEAYLDTSEEDVKKLQTKLENAAETKIEADYPGILDLVAYRIPTEREYSILNLKVKRFLPKVMGGIIMVPSQYVTVAGFDFDIDKLYYFRKEFKQRNELTPEEVTKVWNDIYGLKVDEETGDVDATNATDIYYKLKEAHENAYSKYRELTEEEGEKEYTSKSIGDAGLAESLKAAIGVTEESPDKTDFPDVFKPKNRLFKYWEEAGLQEEKGMSYTDYYNKYLTEHKDKYIKFEEYDYSKDVTENSTVARNNELIKCIQSRLTSIDTFNARYTPGGFINAKRDKRVLKAAMRGLKVPLKEGHTKPTIEDYENYIDNAIRENNKEILDSLDEALDVTNVLTTAEYNAKNRVATKVIGIMANHNTNAVYSKAMGSLTLKEPIKIFGYTLIDLNNSNTGRDYMLTLAELLASSVDAVKDPVLGDLMINSYTANVAALLARLGLSTEEIGLFLNQPIIKEVCNEAINNGDSSITRAIRKVAKKYNMQVNNKYNGNSINKNDLFNSLNQELKSKDLIQENILNAFSNIASVAQALSDFISKTKYTAANSIDNTIGGLIALIYDNKAANEQETLINKHLVMNFSGFSSQDIIEKVESLKSPIILRNDLTLESMQKEEYKKFLDATPFAFEQMMHDAVKAYIKKLGKFFPYTTNLYEGVYNSIYSNMVFGQIDQEIVDTINRQLPVYILNTRPQSQFNPNFSIDKDSPSNKIYYTINFPSKLREFLEDRILLKEAQNKEEEFKALKDKYSFLSNTSLDAILDNELLDKIAVEEYTIDSDDINLYEDDGVRFNITIEEDSQFNKDVKNSLITAWDSLVKDKDLKVNNSRESLAHALFMYNFYTRGYEVGRNAFSNITPLSVIDTLLIDSYTTYNDFYKRLVEGSISSINAHAFLPLFYSNNISNNKVVATLYSLVTDREGNITDTSLPTGKVKAELGEPITIEFDAGSKQNYEAITLPSTKRSGDMKNKRILVPAFKIVDRNVGTKLFILKPNASTDGFNFADPQYNVRNVSSKVSYVEVPIKGITNMTVDYSSEDNNLALTDLKDESTEISAGKDHFPYVESSKQTNRIDSTDEAALAKEQEHRENVAKENRQRNGDC